jgi:DNA-binding transcriptional regulator YbjK
VSDRRSEILDAALRVLAERGMRGLTHRAVDAAARIAAGSTSYYFRSRAALVTGCVDRLLEQDLAREVPEVVAAAPGRLADALTAAAVGMATTQRYRTLARFELTLAAVREPVLRAALRAGGDTIRRLAAAALATAGAPDPVAAADHLAAIVDGLVLAALVRGPEDPAALAAWMHPAVLRALPAAARGAAGGPTGAGV